jgi:hypothetical protein
MPLARKALSSNSAALSLSIGVRPRSRRGGSAPRAKISGFSTRRPSSTGLIQVPDVGALASERLLGVTPSSYRPACGSGRRSRSGPDNEPRHPLCQHTIRHHPGSGRRSAQTTCDGPRLPVPSSLETGFGVLWIIVFDACASCHLRTARTAASQPRWNSGGISVSGIRRAGRDGNPHCPASL